MAEPIPLKQLDAMERLAKHPDHGHPACSKVYLWLIAEIRRLRAVCNGNPSCIHDDECLGL